MAIQKWTEQDQAELVKLAAQGLTADKIALQMGKNPNTVGSHLAALRRRGAIVQSRFAWTDDTRRQAFSMRRRGCTLSEIASAIGCSRSTANQLLLASPVRITPGDGGGRGTAHRSAAHHHEHHDARTADGRRLDAEPSGRHGLRPHS